MELYTSLPPLDLMKNFQATEGHFLQPRLSVDFIPESEDFNIDIIVLSRAMRENHQPLKGTRPSLQKEELFTSGERQQAARLAFQSYYTTIFARRGEKSSPSRSGNCFQTTRVLSCGFDFLIFWARNPRTLTSTF